VENKGNYFKSVYKSITYMVDTYCNGVIIVMLVRKVPTLLNKMLWEALV